MTFNILQSLRFIIALCVTSSLAIFAAAPDKGGKPDKLPKDFKGGDTDAVKEWKSRTFENLKAVPAAYCIYIYDGDRKNNSRAFLLEGKEALGNAGVKEALSKFTKVKIKNDAKGWPEAWMKDSEGGATLVFLSGDKITVIDKRVPAAEVDDKYLIPMIKGIAAHQEGIDKVNKAKEADREKVVAAKIKQEQAEDKANDLSAIPGLDKKKDDAKAKPPAKKGDEKKPADKKPDEVKDAKKKPMAEDE